MGESRGTAPWTALLLVGLGVGCRPLPVVESNTCGNSVVELENGEDCDTFAVGQGTVCARPGEPHQCRYLCSEQLDGSRPSCPSGTRCGLDGLCRAASGRFEAAGAAIEVENLEIFSADADGDGRDDVVAQGRDALNVHYFGSTFALESTTHVPQVSDIGGVSAVVGTLTPDDRDDIVMSTGLGVIVSRGSADRSLAPTAHPNITLDSQIEDLAFVTGEIFPQLPGDELLALGTINGASGLAFVTIDSGVPEVINGTPGPASALAGPMAMENLDDGPEASPCDEVVLSFADASEVLIYGSCTMQADGTIGLDIFGPVVDVTLPEGDRVHTAAIVTELNGDSHRDLALVVTREDGYAIDVAYGVGDGTFHSDPDTLPTADGDGRATIYSNLGDAAAMAIVDLDGNGSLDFVDPFGIHVASAAGGGYVLAARNDGTPWSMAVAADLNANDWLDVAVATDGMPGLDVFSGDGSGRFARTELPTTGPITHAHSGDFDGDFVTDVAFSERIDDGGDGLAPLDSLSILFGTASGPFEVPASMGTLDAVEQIVANQVAENDVIDAIDDPVTLSRAGNGVFSVSFFAGRSNRALRSSYAMTESTTDEMGNLHVQGFFPVRLVVGELTGDGHQDLVELARPDKLLEGNRLWLTPSVSEARLETTEAVPSDYLVPDVAWRRSLAGAVDLDDDGLDEVVVLAALVDDPSAGVAVIGRVVMGDEGTPTWRVDEPVRLPAAFERLETNDAPTDLRRRPPMRIADVDSDGALDVVALGRGEAGEDSVYVFFNDLSGSLTDPTRVEVPGVTTTAFTLLQADDDTDVEIALVAAGDVYLVDVDAAARSFRPVGDPIFSAPEMSTLTTADVDGDGVDDLVPATSGAFSIYAGRALVP